MRKNDKLAIIGALLLAGGVTYWKMYYGDAVVDLAATATPSPRIATRGDAKPSTGIDYMPVAVSHQKIRAAN